MNTFANEGSKDNHILIHTQHKSNNKKTDSGQKYTKVTPSYY